MKILNGLKTIASPKFKRAFSQIPDPKTGKSGDEDHLLASVLKLERFTYYVIGLGLLYEFKTTIDHHRKMSKLMEASPLEIDEEIARLNER